ncbi:unnamed protein product, partial [Mesorhabditis belari]|uniref:Uncharacterized protein n=1 Tax=Mesorhabditis belari TaxID=2138241 RepID=A0AAF3F7Y3_9BILA
MTKTCASRDAIAQLATSGMKNSSIASRLGVALRTVQKIVKQWKDEGHVQSKSGRGPKRTVNTRKMRGIIKRRIERKDDHANYLRRIVDSVKKRIEACIKADGGHFENFL